MRGVAVVAWAVLPFALACGAERSATPARAPAPGEAIPAAPDDTARIACDAACRRAARCEPASSTAICAACPIGDRPSPVRREWALAIAACVDALACAAPLESCAPIARRALGVDPLSLPPIVMRCLEKGASCGGRSGDCLALVALGDAARAQADASFAEPSCARYQARFAALRTRVIDETGAPLLLGMER